MDPQQASRARQSYQNAPDFHYTGTMMSGMDMQLPPIGNQHDPSQQQQHVRAGSHASYDSGSAAAAAAQHHRASIGSGGNTHSPRMMTGQSPQQGHPAMFSQGGGAHAYGASPQQNYGNPGLTGGAGGHHGYQQQQQLYGAYGQHTNPQPSHHAASPHQNYSHISGTSMSGLGGGQFGNPGGNPVMTTNTDYSMQGHPSYTHMHHPGPQSQHQQQQQAHSNQHQQYQHQQYQHHQHHQSQQPQHQQHHHQQQQAQHQSQQQQHQYGSAFALPGGMQHLQAGGSNIMMPSAHQMSTMGQNPMALHGGGAGVISGQNMAHIVGGGNVAAPRGNNAPPTKTKSDGQPKQPTALTGPGSGRGRKSKKALEAAAAAAAQAGGNVTGLMGSMQNPMRSAMPSSTETTSGKTKGAAGRHHPYDGGGGAGGETGAKKKPKKEEPPKPPALKSHLKPPKQAPSAWQVYFTEELQKMKLEQPGERLNVAHVAKDAGQRYAALPDEKKKEYQRKSLEAKAEWEREMEAWRQTLTPEDIKQENMFRTAQRKAGKSRKGNLKDPNAPKKPLSAYFLFLRAIRADPALTQSVFEGEQETTKQSVLAASKWRALPEAEKQPYLEKAESDKSEYERLRREYESTHADGRKGVSGLGGGNLMGMKRDDSDDDDDDDDGGDVDDDPTAHHHFKMDAPFHDDQFIGAPLDDHFGTNPDGSSLKPEDLL